MVKVFRVGDWIFSIKWDICINVYIIIIIEDIMKWSVGRNNVRVRGWGGKL